MQMVTKDQMGLKRLTWYRFWHTLQQRVEKNQMFHHLKQKHWSEYEESQKLQEEKSSKK